MALGVRYVVNSDNSKIGKCDAVYLSMKTCPSSCPLKGNGCYAEDSYVGMLTSKLNKEAADLGSIKLAMNEAQVIRESYKGGHVPNADLRLHVSGDCSSVRAVGYVRRAVEDWRRRGGGSVWSYTHAWKEVHRKHWGLVSCLGSIERVEDVDAVRKQGYVPAVVVSHLESAGKSFEGGGVKFIKCPAQEKENMTCDKCRLCFDDKKLLNKNMGIAFSSHGARKNKLLKVIA